MVNTQTMNPGTYEAQVQATVAGRLTLLYRKMTLRVEDGTVTLAHKDQEVFRSAVREVSLKHSGINGTMTIASRGAAYVVKFYEQSHPFRTQSWHNQMMYKKHDDFIKALAALGVPNLPDLIGPSLGLED
jgi:hypothetical protein